MPDRRRVLHLAERPAWDAALATGRYTGSTRGRALDEVGFVHLSTAGQLPGVMAVVFAEVPAEHLVLLVVDLSAVEARGTAVRWENLDGGTEPYPHVYGPIAVEDVVATLPLDTADGGALELPSLAGLEVLDQPPA